MKKNEIYRVTVSGYTAQGLGVARVDGQVVFIHGALKGEEMDIRIVKVLKQECYAIVEKMVAPSPYRITPDCPYNRHCGGCATRHMDYEEELRFKAERVTDALNRIGGENLDTVPIFGAEDTEHYRNKAIFPVGLVQNRPDAGFYRARSHDLIPVEACKIQSPWADCACSAVVQWLREYQIPVYDEASHTGLLRHIFVRVAEQQTMVTLVVNGKKLPHEKELVAKLQEKVPYLRTVVLNENTRKGNAILGETYRTLWGDGVVEGALCGLKFRLSPASFYQVNHDQAERLYGIAMDFAGLTGEETVLDLYCGTGTITLCLAGRCKEAIGVEIVPEAIEDAKENAQNNGILNARFFCADAGEAARRLQMEGTAPHVVVVDPPRKGLQGDVIPVIASMNPQKVVYVSCDPGTLARDVALFRENGYILQKAVAVDLFPRTHHVESVVLLEKSGENSEKS
ncbi:MAG: 23S rRNA (uracil(1939)-C(5))-methyltransferase RlmD [Oscillospiraceae bacterium]|nr:23S rRNA (uracil(1939)-C(5))-methyltransferase RlmD [Oscillospiraceae bacterium]